ncbi:filamin-B-like [Hypanus sabinus]|uniref:filamin-B-like n=1 Tax=Hypanus sabinus TaxID=79690 RepID=UPI0028C38E55|nr:filamin-B-like [Hypanus sabinus]
MIVQQWSSMLLPLITVLFAGQHISKSPFEVNIDKAHGDADKVTARGPGLESSGNFANKPTYFDIYTAGAGVGNVEVVIVDPQGHNINVTIEDKGNNTNRCSYRPSHPGHHTIRIVFADSPIPKNPYFVNISEAIHEDRGVPPKNE